MILKFYRFDKDETRKSSSLRIFNLDYLCHKFGIKFQPDRGLNLKRNFV